MSDFRVAVGCARGGISRLLRHLAVLSSVALSSILGACASDTSQSHVLSNNDSMRFRSTAEQRQTERRALAGNVEAAKRLADYYFFIKYDLVAAKRWISIAAARGDKDAKASLRSINEILAEQNDSRKRTKNQ